MNIAPAFRRIEEFSVNIRHISAGKQRAGIRWMAIACFLLLAMLAADFCRTAGAQEISGSLRGTVLDASGSAVSGAKVSATNKETGLTRSTVSDAKGEYALVELPVGPYQLQVEAAGFQKFVQEGITLTVTQHGTATVHLAVGTAMEKLEVKANADVMATTSTSLGQTVGDREILELPLNGRHFTQLGLLQPGVVPITPGLAAAGWPRRAGHG